MIKIYGSKRSSAFRCIWLLEEMGLQYESISLDFKKGENKTEEYLKLNPNGKIPTMVDGEFVLWESLAINYYLLEKYQSLPLAGNNSEEHGQVNQWVLWSMLHLSESLHPLLMQKFRGTPDTEVTKVAREQEAPRYLAVLDKQLTDRDFIVLNQFSLADLTVMSVLYSIGFINFDISNYKNIVRWMEKISERPAYKKMMAE